MKHSLISTDSIESLIAEIDKTIKNSFMPTLAFIYVSVDYDIEALVEQLFKYKFIVVGSSTAGEVYADSSVGVHTKDKSLTCMLVDMDASAFSIKLKRNKNNKFFKLGLNIGKWVNKSFSSASLLTITAGLEFDNESYLNGIKENHADIFGGTASDDRKFKGTYVFTRNKIVKDGVLALAIDKEKIEITPSQGFGWSGIGIQRVVTKSDKNIVYTIDDKPAIEFYTEYLNITSDDMPSMGIDFPMEVVSQDDEIVNRAVIDINKDGSLLCAGHVKEGSRVKISIPIGLKVIDNVVNSIKETVEDTNIVNSDLTLLFPCTAHKELFGTLGVKEVEAVFNLTKNRPLIGFYTYGEFSSFYSSSIFHNETFVIIQMKEKR
jgi:hypothetical protein